MSTDGKSRFALYGTFDISEKAATSALQKTYEWHKFGDILSVYIGAVVNLGKQYIALLIVVINVFATKQYLASCDGRVIGFHEGLLCESSKAATRFFPLLAMVVSIMVAARFVLRTRIYYELLKHGAMVDFENISPMRDNLFIIVLVGLVLAIPHFVYKAYVMHRGKVPINEVMSMLKGALAFYLTPTIAFIIFLFDGYDTEAKLITFSKYFEEAPDDMRAMVAHMPVITEAQCYTVAEQGLQLTDVHGDKCTATDAYHEFCKRAVLLRECEEGLEEAGTVAPLTTESAVHRVTAFESAFWPALILLDKRIQCEHTLKFRRVWHCFASLCLTISIAIPYYFLLQAQKDVMDIQGGQTEDVGGLLVESVYAVFSFYFLWHFLSISIVAFWKKAPSSVEAAPSANPSVFKPAPAAAEQAPESSGT